MTLNKYYTLIILIDMGYISKDIAVITEPEQISLATNPNFVVFEAKPADKQYFEVNIEVKDILDLEEFAKQSQIRIKEPKSTEESVCTISGTTDKDNVTDTVFYVSEDVTETTENIRNALLANEWVSTNFEIKINYQVIDNKILGNIINIKSKGAGDFYNISIETGKENYKRDITVKSLPLALKSGIQENDNTAYRSESQYLVSGTEGMARLELRFTTLHVTYIALALYNSSSTAVTTFLVLETDSNNLETGTKILDIKIPNDFVRYEIKYYVSDPNNFKSDFTIESFKLINEAYQLNWVHDKSENNDSLSGEKMSIEVELDIFEDTNRFLGTVEETNDSFYLGKPLLSVQKTYTGIPIWFELNALFSKKVGYNAPTEKLGWYDTATISDFRFVAKTKKDNNIPFYYSDPLYVLNGYGYSLDPLHLEPYIYNYKNSNDKPIKLLSNKLSGTYMKGQKEYINFIFSDEKREGRMRPEYKIGVAYKLYTFSGEYINTVHDHEISRKDLSMVNTCVIDLTETLGKKENTNTGKVEVVLTCNGAEISESLKLEILPECLHKLNTFTFLNKLGGWDSFNMDAEIETESKQTSNTYNKTITPGFGVGDSRETVYSTDIELTHSLETKPLDSETRVWLQELLASPVIFDADGNYVIIKSSKLPISSLMETFTLKYQLSDKYNG